jgi:hypothetical protein
MKKRFRLDVTVRDGHYDKTTRTCKLSASSFELTEIGIHIGHTSHWEINQDDLKSWGISTINSNLDLQDKKIYRYPKLDLPRQKVDLLKEKFNVKVIRDPKKADVHVMSVKYINDILETSWTNVYELKAIFEFLKALKDNDKLTKTGLEKVREVLAGLPNDCWVELQHNYNYNNDVDTDILLNFVKEKVSIVQESHNFNRSALVKIANINLYNDIVNSNVELTLDTDIINIINSDLAVIDSDEYDNVKSMVLSSDKDNRSLALEMLANCNIEKSFDVVSGIFYWHLEFIKNTTNWNTVNVKAFRKRMFKYDGHHETSNIGSYDNYIRLLELDNKLTKFAVDATRKRLYKHILNNVVGRETSAFYIDLDDVVLSNNYVKNLEINE